MASESDSSCDDCDYDFGDLNVDDEDIEPIATEEEKEVYKNALAKEEQEEDMLKKRFQSKEDLSWYVSCKLFCLVILNEYLL